MQMTQLRRLREARGLSREQLAVLSGVSYSAIVSHELRMDINPFQSTAEALAKVLEVPVQALFFETDTDGSVTAVEKSAA